MLLNKSSTIHGAIIALPTTNHIEPICFGGYDLYSNDIREVRIGGFEVNSNE